MNQYPPQHPYNLEQWKQYQMQQQAMQQGYVKKKKGCGCGKKKKVDTNNEEQK